MMGCLPVCAPRFIYKFPPFTTPSPRFIYKWPRAFHFHHNFAAQPTENFRHEQS